MSATVLNKLVDAATCCICNETYRDPKILPCIHTFCLTCLQHTGTQTEKRPGDTMPCPFCRQEFTVPLDGFTALKKNFFMEKLVEIATNEQEISSTCDKHEHENPCLYCSDCKEVLCLVCLRESHQNHRLSDLSSVANSLRYQLQGNIGTARHCISDALEKKERIAHKKIAVIESIEGIEREVLQVMSDLKALIDQHADSLLQNLGYLKKKGIADFEIEEMELEKHLSCLNNFMKCCEELTSSDLHGNLAHIVARELAEQIVELELVNKVTVERHLCSFDIGFKKTIPAPLAEFREKESGSLFGKVEAKIDDYLVNPKLVATISAKSDVDGISGMSVSDNKVFILNYRSPIVTIYDSNALNCLQRQDINGFVSQVDLKHCASVNGTIYIINRISREIFLINQDREMIRWSAKDHWGRLSISDTSTIVATCYKRNAIREYTPKGTLLDEIKLCSSVLHPSHAIKLHNGQFVVSHGGFYDDLKRVCIVNHVGGVMKSFGDSSGSNIVQLDVPTCLAVDNDGNVLVLDGYNSRVLLLSPELEFKRELLTEANGLRWPVAMHFDKKTSRLYIADNKWEKFQWSDGRLLVFNVK